MPDEQTPPDIPPPHRYPGWLYVVMALAGLGLLGFGAWVAISPDLARDAFGSLVVRILLSVGIALVGTFLVGFIGIKGTIKGIPVEAGGGIALGVLFFFAAPDANGAPPPDPPVPDPVARVEQPNLIDFRSSDPGDGFRASDPRAGQLYVTVDLGVTNTAEPSRRLTWRETEATLHLGGTAIPLRQYSFTHLGDEAKWLGERSSAGPVSVAPGESVAREVMFTPTDPGDAGATWAGLLALIEHQPGLSPRLEIAYRIGIGAEETEIPALCEAQVAGWSAQIAQAREAATRHYPRVTVYCAEEEPA